MNNAEFIEGFCSGANKRTRSGTLYVKKMPNATFLMNHKRDRDEILLVKIYLGLEDQVLVKNSTASTKGISRAKENFTLQMPPDKDFSDVTIIDNKGPEWLVSIGPVYFTIHRELASSPISVYEIISRTAPYQVGKNSYKIFSENKPSTLEESYHLLYGDDEDALVYSDKIIVSSKITDKEKNLIDSICNALPEQNNIFITDSGMGYYWNTPLAAAVNKLRGLREIVVVNRTINTWEGKFFQDQSGTWKKYREVSCD